MRQRRVSLDVLDFSLLIIDQFPNNNNFGFVLVPMQFDTLVPIFVYTFEEDTGYVQFEVRRPK
jgi:hypothetical protein